MGQARVKQRSTAEFVQNFPVCCLCGERPTATREHMPPKALFENKHRPDQLVMPACDECNRGTSTADLVVSVISRWGFEQTPYGQADHSKLISQIRIQAPDVLREWEEAFTPTMQRRGQLHLKRQGLDLPPGTPLVTIGPLTVRHLNVFSHKVVLALYFEHFKRALSNDGRVQAFWRSKEDFHHGIPLALINIMGGYNKLVQGRWDTGKTFEYKFGTNVADGMFGCFVRFRQGLYVLGFAVENKDILSQNDALQDGGWLAPRDLLGPNPHFAKRQL